MDLSIATTNDDASWQIVVTGEVDVSNAGELRAAVDRAFEASASSVELDLAQVSYIDSTGIGVLVGASHRAQETGTKLVVARPQANVRRVLGLLGVDKELKISE